MFNVEYRQLGRSGKLISRLGFGCWAIGGHGYGRVDDEESKRAIRKGLDVGINLFDTAAVYGFGHSEKVLSDGLGTARRDVVIATKFGVCWDEQGRTYKNCNPKAMWESLHNSLRRLRVDTIPLYQLHWHDGVTPIHEIMDALMEAQRVGKIQCIGFSNLDCDLTKGSTALRMIESLQIPFGLTDQRFRSVLERAHDGLGIATLPYGVLARGLLTGKYDTDATFGEADTRSRDPQFGDRALQAVHSLVKLLHILGKKYDKTPAQVAIRWVLDSHSVTSAIVGAKTEEQVASNVGASGWRLGSEDFDRLREQARRTNNDRVHEHDLVMTEGIGSH